MPTPKIRLLIDYEVYGILEISTPCKKGIIFQITKKYDISVYK